MDFLASFRLMSITSMIFLKMFVLMNILKVHNGTFFDDLLTLQLIEKMRYPNLANKEDHCKYLQKLTDRWKLMLI